MLHLEREKNDLGWMLARKRAVAEFFGAKHGPLVAPLVFDAFNLYVHELTMQALAQGLVAHGLDVDDRLEALMKRHGWGPRVPYAQRFAKTFARDVAGQDPDQVIEHLLGLCFGYERDHPALFRAADGGYQYLLDVLVETRRADTVADTPALARACAWLAAHAGPKPAALSRPGPPPEEALAWAAVLVGPATRAGVEALLEALALLARGPGGQPAPAPESTPSAWVGAVAALQTHRWLGRNQAAVARALHASYGAVVSLRALQAGFKEDNAAQAAAHHRAVAWVRQHPAG